MKEDSDLQTKERGTEEILPRRGSQARPIAGFRSPGLRENPFPWSPPIRWDLAPPFANEHRASRHWGLELTLTTSRAPELGPKCLPAVPCVSAPLLQLGSSLSSLVEEIAICVSVAVVINSSRLFTRKGVITDFPRAVDVTCSLFSCHWSFVLSSLLLTAESKPSTCTSGLHVTVKTIVK